MLNVQTKTRLITTLSHAIVILGLVGASHAMGQAAALDGDADGMISYAELLVAMPDMTEAEFQALDADGDGMLNADELAAAQDAGLIPAG
jgi:hypothetical protein